MAMPWRGEGAVPGEAAAEPSHRDIDRDRVTLASGAAPALQRPLSRSGDPIPGAASAAPASKYQLIATSATETVATAGDCVLVVVQKTVSAIGVSAIQRAFEQLEADYEQVGYLSFIEGSRCAPMDARARKLMADVVGRHTRRIGVAAMVVVGDGFRTTVVRSILTGIHLASRAAHPMRAFSALEPALVWYQATWPRRKLPPSALRDALFELYPPAAKATR